MKPAAATQVFLCCFIALPAALCQMEAAGALLQSATKAIFNGVGGAIMLNANGQPTAIDPATLNADGITGTKTPNSQRGRANVEAAALATADALGSTAGSVGGNPTGVDAATIGDVAQRTANAAGNGTGPLSIVAQILSPVGDAAMGTVQSAAQGVGLSAVLDFTNLPSKNITNPVPDEVRTILWLPAMMPQTSQPPATPSPYKGFLFPNETTTVSDILNATNSPVKMYWGTLDGLPQTTSESALGLPDGVLPIRDGSGAVVATFHPSRSGNPYLYFGVGASDSDASLIGYYPGGIGPKKDCSKSATACSLASPIYTSGVSITIANASLTRSFALVSLWMNSYFPITIIGHRMDGTTVKRVLEGTYPVPSADAQKAAAQRYGMITSVASMPLGGNSAVNFASNILASPINTAVDMMSTGGKGDAAASNLYDRIFPSGVPDAVADTASRTVTAAAGAATTASPLVNLVYGRTFKFDVVEWSRLERIEFTSPDVINTMLVLDDIMVNILGDVGFAGTEVPMRAASTAASTAADLAVNVAKQVPNIRLPGLPAIPGAEVAAPLADLAPAVMAIPFADILLNPQAAAPTPAPDTPSEG